MRDNRKAKRHSSSRGIANNAAKRERRPSSPVSYVRLVLACVVIIVAFGGMSYLPEPLPVWEALAVTAAVVVFLVWLFVWR